MPALSALPTHLRKIDQRPTVSALRKGQMVVAHDTGLPRPSPRKRIDRAQHTHDPSLQGQLIADPQPSQAATQMRSGVLITQVVLDLQHEDLENHHMVKRQLTIFGASGTRHILLEFGPEQLEVDDCAQAFQSRGPWPRARPSVTPGRRTGPATPFVLCISDSKESHRTQKSGF